MKHKTKIKLIPEAFKLMGKTINVIQGDECVYAEDEKTIISSYFSPAKLHIFIRKDLDEYQKLNAFLHELIHCFYYLIGSDQYDNEMLAQGESQLLYEMLCNWRIV